jgi:hypothetical protein
LLVGKIEKGIGKSYVAYNARGIAAALFYNNKQYKKNSVVAIPMLCVRQSLF